MEEKTVLTAALKIDRKNLERWDEIKTRMVDAIPKGTPEVDVMSATCMIMAALVDLTAREGGIPCEMVLDAYTKNIRTFLNVLDKVRAQEN